MASFRGITGGAVRLSLRAARLVWFPFSLHSLEREDCCAVQTLDPGRRRGAAVPRRSGARGRREEAGEGGILLRLASIARRRRGPQAGRGLAEGGQGRPRCASPVQGPLGGRPSPP